MRTLLKIDFKKELKNLYNTSSKEVAFIDVPKMNYIMIDGIGNPNTSKDFSDAVEALFSLSYTLKFMIKKDADGTDYGVMPLEGLWWADDMSSFSIDAKDGWKWTVMIMQPEYVTEELYKKALTEVEKKKGLVAPSKARFESYEEGASVQIMHIGPFSEEGPTVEKLHCFIRDKGYEYRGKHHEIYLSDIRKGSPDKWKTIIRQPVVKP